MSKKIKILLLVVIAIVIGVGIYFAYGLFNKKDEKVTISENYLLKIYYSKMSIPPSSTTLYLYADNHMEKYEHHSCSAVDCGDTSKYSKFNSSRNISIQNLVDIITDPANDIYKCKVEEKMFKSSYIYVQRNKSYYDTKILNNKYLLETYYYILNSYKEN